ncbi:glycosyl transferase family 1 [Cytophagales bacterium WSM2-2]|nr:glycosyl transferase family 1 [Cytophagales bacterium WSM2-2]
MPRKVLIITYYWPPAGGIAVQRWVKFCKYLKTYDWEPVVFTVSNGHYQLTDNSMLKDVSPDLTVIKRPIWEPYQLYQLFAAKQHKDANINPDEIKPGQGASLTKKISNWIRSNFFIPDARKFWIKPSVQFLATYLKENTVEAMISTGPPHSAHLIALHLKKKTDLPWLADFRDPWTTMDYYHELLLTRWADRKHHRLEREVLTIADAVTVVGGGMKKEFELKRNREVFAVTNGFDEDDFAGENVGLSKDFSVVHIGSFFARINPRGLWKALAELKAENHPLLLKLKIELTGRVAPSVIDSIREHGLEKYLSVSPFRPHEEAVKVVRRAAILLLCVYEQTPFVVTGKLFEYLAASRPILYIGPTEGDAAKIVLETGAGSVFSHDEVSAIKKHLIHLFNLFESGELKLNSAQSQKFSHRYLSGQIADQLNRITS